MAENSYFWWMFPLIAGENFAKNGKQQGHVNWQSYSYHPNKSTGETG